MTRPEDLSRALLRQSPPPPLEFDEAELDMLSIFRLVRRRIWLIAAVAVLLTVAALPSILAMQPVYYAELRMLLQNPLATKLTSSNESRLVPLNLTTEVERLMSREAAARVIEKLELARRSEFNPALRNASLFGAYLDEARSAARGLLISGETDDVRPTPLDPTDRIIPEYMDALSIARNPSSDVIQIGFRSRDPELAVMVPSTLLQIYLEERKSHLEDQIGQASAWIVQRIEEQVARVSECAAALRRFERQSGTVSGASVTSTIATIGDLNAKLASIAQRRFELSAAVTSLEAAQTRAERLRHTQSDALDELNRDLRVQKLELDRLLLIYGNNHESVVAVRGKISDAETRIDLEIDRYLQSLKSKVLSLMREETAVTAGLDTARNSLASQNAGEAQRLELVRAVETEQLALDRLEDQRRALAAESKLPTADVEILSPATIPLWPQGRGRMIYLIGAIVTGVVVGLTVACVLELLDASVRAHEQLRAVRGLVPAGMVPALSRRAARDLPRSVSRGSNPLFHDAMLGIALSLEQSGDGAMPSSVMITSALPGEGASFVASAMALEIAATGRPVLLVDCNLHGGRLDVALGGTSGPGLAELIRGERRLPEVVHHHAESGIDYISRGDTVTPLRDRDLVAKILRFGAERRQLVILSGPPVLANAETGMLSGLSERTLLVVRWGKTSRNAVTAAAQRLRAARGENILVAINMVDPRRHALYGFKDGQIFSGAIRRYHGTAA